MNLDSVVKQGCLPWSPSAQVSGLDVWHQYEVPLTGVFWIQDVAVLFTLVYEYDHDISVWAYVDLEDEDVDALPALRFGSVEELTAWVEERFLGREAVLALVRGERIASRWTRQMVESDLLSATDSFLSAVIQSVERVPDTATRIRAKMAGLDAARSELPERLELLEV